MTPTALDSTREIVQKIVQQSAGAIWLVIEAHDFFYIACRDKYDEKIFSILQWSQHVSRKENTNLSSPVFVIETVCPIHKAGPAAGCYLNAVPCIKHKIILVTWIYIFLFFHKQMIHEKNASSFAPSTSPERHHVAKLCWQAPDLIRGQVQEHKVVQLGNVWWDAWKAIVI